MGEQERRGRGRPREVRRPEPGTGLPVELSLADLSPTSRAILAAAQVVAGEDGVAHLTLRAVAQRAHVDLSTVKYHFQTKAGLLEALLDSLYRDDVARFAAVATRTEGVAARPEAYFEIAEHDMMEGRDRLRIYFELQAYALRDPFFAERLAAHDRWFVEAMLGLLYGPERVVRELTAPSAQALWALFVAVIDGITIHHAIAPDQYPLHEVLALLKRLTLEMTGSGGERGEPAGSGR